MRCRPITLFASSEPVAVQMEVIAVIPDQQAGMRC